MTDSLLATVSGLGVIGAVALLVVGARLSSGMLQVLALPLLAAAILVNALWSHSPRFVWAIRVLATVGALAGLVTVLR